ncbi:metallophosphoesterase [Chondromyces crocatus]|uniref:Metallophosphatase n=1 Tax=Chondromyces crocatus TaxID=52 RepID=A0A0K1ESW1_CHOCO|nr:metallophosphoesterase [Chondromyces crocatus]AKT43951.1 metallophosphatase [Chondromyces crocatus]
MQRSVLSLVIFVLLFSAVLGGMHYYLWFRLVRTPELAQPLRRVLTWVFVALATSVPVGLMLMQRAPRPIGGVIAAVVYGWVGLTIVLFFLLVTMEFIRLGAHAVSALGGAPFNQERRTFLGRMLAGAAGVLGVGLGAAGLASALGEVAVRPVQVRLRKLPGSLSGFRIVQLTDIHVGPTIGRAWLEGIVERVNALKPDLVAITGDLVDGKVEDLRDEVAPLAKLQAKYGVFFVTGNHEYYSGADEWIAELGRLGVRVLRNERVSIGEGDESFDLVGVDDWTAKRFGNGHGPDLERALAGRDPSREVVLLAHQPKQVVQAAAMGVGLQLSGHTHGGQIFPWGYFVRLDQPHLEGLERRGETQIYVSRGTGYWGPPMRVGAPPEISLVELAREDTGTA